MWQALLLLSHLLSPHGALSLLQGVDDLSSAIYNIIYYNIVVSTRESLNSWELDVSMQGSKDSTYITGPKGQAGSIYSPSIGPLLECRLPGPLRPASSESFIGTGDLGTCLLKAS